MLWKGEFRQRFANGQYAGQFGAIDQDAGDAAGVGRLAETRRLARHGRDARRVLARLVVEGRLGRDA